MPRKEINRGVMSLYVSHKAVEEFKPVFCALAPLVSIIGIVSYSLETDRSITADLDIWEALFEVLSGNVI